MRLLTSAKTIPSPCQQSHRKYNHIAEWRTRAIPCTSHIQRKVISRNHRGWEGSLVVSSPTPWAKQGQLQQVAHGFVQLPFQYLQERRVHSLPGQPLPGLNHHRREKKILPWISSEIPVFQPGDVVSHPNTTHLQGEPGFFAKPSHWGIKDYLPPKKKKKIVVSFPPSKTF